MHILNRFSSSRALCVVAVMMLATVLPTVAFCGEIHDAAKQGDLAKVRSLLANDPTLVSSKDESGWTPLHDAVFGAHPEVAEFLLSKGADVNAREKNGATPLIIAAMGGKIEIDGQGGVVALLLAHKADINAKSANGMTALHVAALVGHADAVRLLLAKGANPDAEDQKGNTPSYYAAQQGRQEVVKLLSAKRPATITTGKQTTEQYELLVDPSRNFGITAQLSLRSMDQAGDCSGDIEGTVDMIMVGSKPLEMVTNAIVHDGDKAWIVTKQYGKIRISGGYAGDNPPSGLCFWLTPSQKTRIKALYHAQ